MTQATATASRTGVSAPAPTGSCLEVLHLQKSYGSRKVVKDVSLVVQKGEVVGLLGFVSTVALARFITRGDVIE